MVKLGFRQLSKLMLGLGSNPKNDNFIFHFSFLTSWSSESSQCKNFGEIVARYFIIACFTQKSVITFNVVNISPKFLYWDDSELQPDKIYWKSKKKLPIVGLEPSPQVLLTGFWSHGLTINHGFRMFLVEPMVLQPYGENLITLKTM
jgi:hypothetical protein